MKPRFATLFAAVAASLLFSLSAPTLVRAEPPKILEFRVQEVNQKIYFHLRVQRPADMAPENQDGNRRFFFDPWGDMQWTDPSLRPRLVPQDDSVRLVFSRQAVMGRFDRRFGFNKDPRFEKDFKEKDKDVKEEKREFKDKDKDFKAEKGFGDQEKGFKGKDERAENTALDFYGVFTGKKAALFLMIYPKNGGLEPMERKKLSLYELLQQKNQWVEEKVQLDPAKAKKVPLPNQGFRRDENRPISDNDLEGNWALAQSTHFAMLESQTPEFGFYGFARETTNRLYKVRGPDAPWRPWMNDRNMDGLRHKHGEIGRLYEVTTGAAAITESLALNRMRDRGRFKDNEEARTVPISEVRGVDIAEHPWQKMMGDKKPASEPLAKLVPHDNYYIHFKTITKFLETGDLLDEWGTSLARAYEVNSRDYRIKQKLEQQICLKSTGLARVFGPAVIKSMAITGNDPYLREGSDFTIIFQVTNKTLFQTGAEPTLSEARKKFGKDLKEDKAQYQGITIESFVTPYREVSLHRANFDNFAVYSNSGVAVRRVIDAHKNKIKRLADSLDFQYMRTVFRLDDPNEDGFIFLSDAFIRNLVGPAVRIKERRRLEALTSLHMVTNGAMYTSWETGKLPQNYEHIIQTTGLQAQELFMPDGNAIIWDSEKKLGVSSVYNTQHFATPLIEIPIDNVTRSEAQEYNMFRAQYMGLWRQFFDPIGMRISLKKEQVKTEIYILPLVRTTQYNELRRFAGNGTVKVDSSMFSDKTLVKYLMHISPDLFGPGGPIGPGGLADSLFIDMALRSWLGDWFAVRFDDSPVYAKLMESYIRSQMFPEERHDFIDDMTLLFEMPLTVGFDVRSPMIFAGLVTGVRKAMENTLPGAFDWGPMDKPYKGTTIVRIKTSGERLGGIVGPEGRRLNPTFYYALVDSAFFISFKEEPIKDLIDRSVALKDRKDKKADVAEVNSSLHLGPKAAVQSKDLLRMYLEYETHRRAQTNNRLLYALFRSNVVGPRDDSSVVEAAALQYLGFVPVSPDLAPFRYEWQKEEVVNLRHGSLRQPKLNPGIEPTSPLGRMLEQFATIRADLRFREDGIHTTLTMKRNAVAEVKRIALPAGPVRWENFKTKDGMILSVTAGPVVVAGKRLFYGDGTVAMEVEATPEGMEFLRVSGIQGPSESIGDFSRGRDGFLIDGTRKDLPGARWFLGRNYLLATELTPGSIYLITPSIQFDVPRPNPGRAR
jgi:hypothetical protein